MSPTSLARPAAATAFPWSRPARSGSSTGTRLRGGEVDGLDLHYIVAGRGPAVVLVHGLGGFAESWRHTTRALADRTTVYALDLPGFGASAKPPARYRLSYFASALHGFMEVL